jgi:hypothetical protein
MILCSTKRWSLRKYPSRGWRARPIFAHTRNSSLTAWQLGPYCLIRWAR